MNNGNIISKQWYQKLSYTKMFLFLFIMVAAGHVLNMLWKHKHFYVNQYSLLIMLIIQIVILKKLDLENEIIEKNLKKRGKCRFGEVLILKSQKAVLLCGMSSFLFFLFLYISLQCLKLDVWNIRLLEYMEGA